MENTIFIMNGLTWIITNQKIIVVKGAFFSESEIRFSNLPISQKKYSKKTILSLKFEIPAHNSKQLIQISISE